MEDDRAGDGLQSVEVYQALYPGYEDRVAKKVAQVAAGDTVGGEGVPGFLEEGATFGAYRIEGMLGQGGQGVVYKARDERLNRSVALKILDLRGPGLGDAFNRFQREAEVAARLQHPGICSVYESGMEDGVPFIAMQLVEGISLSDALTTLRAKSSGATVSFQSTFGEGDDDFEVTDEEGTADPDMSTDLSGPDRAKMDHVLRIVEDIARALHVAHEAGVVHRDIKPGNVMIRDDDTPVILDFGLAHDLLGEGVTLTRPGDLLGTPAFMSPEQLLHNQVILDRRTDVWSLGVVLYEYLTYRRPFEAPTRQSLFQAIATRDPLDPRKLNGAITTDLAVVLSTALEKERDRRYQTALDLAEELRRVRKREPIMARPVSALTRLVRWGQRNPALAAMTAAAALILIAGATAATVFALRADANATKAEANATKAEANATKAEANLTEWERLADGRRLDDRLEEANGPLWPVVPKSIPAYRMWLEKTRALTARIGEHESALEALRRQGTYDAEGDRGRMAVEYARLAAIPADVAKAEAKARDAEAAKARLSEELTPLENKAENDGLSRREERARQRLQQGIDEADASLEAAAREVTRLASERRRLLAKTAVRWSWTFTDEGEQLRHDKLRDLVAGLRRLLSEASPKTVTLAGIEKRLAEATELDRRLEEDDVDRWRRCIEDLATSDEQYTEPVTLTPVPGLVPLGRDRDSKLWEFWHVPSGACPAWEAAAASPFGKVKLHESSGAAGMVMVLLPGGTFSMGSRAPDATHPVGSPNVDDQRYEQEGPVHEVTLDAYFFAKHEVTQGQWVRSFANNPSQFQPGMTRGGQSITLRMPVTDVDWDQCREACHRWGLVLPTESQWEYAGRAGTSTRYFTGDEMASLRGFANIADKNFIKDGGTGERDFDDGFSVQAAIGVLKPNAFGLHDVLGNVWEWCRDGFDPNAYGGLEAAAGDGLRIPWRGDGSGVLRGGSFRYVARVARSAMRRSYDPGSRSFNVGFRPALNLTTF